MRSRTAIVTVAFSLLVLMLGISLAQRWERRYRRGRVVDPSVDRNGVPKWENDQQFKEDIFTFVRVQYSSYGRYGKWRTDYPDSDLNFSYRLQELTSLKVDPNGKILKLTDDTIFDHPFLYMIEPGDMYLDEAEVFNLRKYLLNGGFLMVDDFWGPYEYQNFYEQIKRVFPDREPQELPLEHEIFQCVYQLAEKPTIPSIHAFWNGYRSESRGSANYKGIFDDNERMMVIICHNTDLGDGWEREGLDSAYFHQYSEKWSYPLGINIVTYAMTH